MRQEKIEIEVAGQQSGPAILTSYLIDAVSVNPHYHRPAVIICPGGGYSRRSDRESEPIALKFMAMGYHAFIMDYSVAPNHFPVALLELAEAVARIRHSAKLWKVDMDRIVVCGFSAGGHLACSLGVFWNQEFIARSIHRSIDEIKPNGMILCYPVITSGEFAHENSFVNLLGEEAGEKEWGAVSLEKQVSSDTPRTFLWHTDTDESVPVENSLLLAMELKKHGVSCEFHMFPEGGHGLSLANQETAGENGKLVVPVCQSWISLAEAWMRQL